MHIKHTKIVFISAPDKDPALILTLSFGVLLRDLSNNAATHAVIFHDATKWRQSPYFCTMTHSEGLELPVKRPVFVLKIG